MAELYRFHISGLPLNYEISEKSEQRLKDLFKGHGKVKNLEIKEKRDVDGNVIRKFAFVSLSTSSSKALAYVAQNSKLQFEDHILSVALAREFFPDRLKKERSQFAASPVSPGNTRTNDNKQWVQNKDKSLHNFEAHRDSAKKKCGKQDVDNHVKTHQAQKNSDLSILNGKYILKSKTPLLNTPQTNPRKKLSNSVVKHEKKENGNKSKVSEAKRRQSIQRQQDRYSQQQAIIQQAFKAGGVAKATRKVFESESESDTEPDKVHISQQQEGESMQLFDDDDGDGDEMGDGEMLEIKPQYEGVDGRQMLEMQMKFSDKRFKMDERFMKDIKAEGKSKSTEDIHTPSPISLADNEREKQRNLEILQGIVGTRPVLATKRKDKKHTTCSSMVRFDPSVTSHGQYVVKPGSSGTEKESVSSDPEDTPTTSHGPALPAMSQAPPDTDITRSLKEAFASSATTQGATFRFTDLFGERVETDHKGYDVSGGGGDDEMMKLDVGTVVSVSSYDSTDSEDDEDEQVDEGGTGSSKPKRMEEGRKTFFFTKHDQRFKVGQEFFFSNKKSPEEWYEEWKEKRVGLLENYRMRRKRAMKRKKKEGHQHTSSYQHSVGKINRVQ